MMFLRSVLFFVYIDGVLIANGYETECFQHLDITFV